MAEYDNHNADAKVGSWEYDERVGHLWEASHRDDDLDNGEIIDVVIPCPSEWDGKGMEVKVEIEANEGLNIDIWRKVRGITGGNPQESFYNKNDNYGDLGTQLKISPTMVFGGDRIQRLFIGADDGGSRMEDVRTVEAERGIRYVITSVTDDTRVSIRVQVRRAYR